MSSLPNEKNIKRAKKQIKAKKKPRHPHQKPPRKKSRAEKERIRERQNQAMELRMSGATYRSIASSLGYANPASAKKAVDTAISKIEIDAAKEVVAIDLARLDEYTMRCTHALRTNGDLQQIDRLMRIMEMRYKLLGVNDETVRELQNEHGITTHHHNKNIVMNVNAAPETEEEFIRKMMGAVGVNPESPEAQQFVDKHKDTPHALPMLEGSANETANRAEKDAPPLSEDEVLDNDVVDAEIVEEM